MTLRRSVTLTAILLALLLAAYAGVLEPIAEWGARHLHRPYTHYQQS